MKEIVINELKNRGVNLDDMVELVLNLQKNYISLTAEEALENIHKVLDKREVQNALLTGIQLDKLAEKQLLEEPLLTIIRTDESLYGIDEILALSITNIYGSIGFTNYGYLDKTKPGIIGKLNKHENDQVNTFLDDLISGIVAAACSRLAHAKTKEKAREEL